MSERGEVIGLNLKDKAVVITGASRGIGRAIALGMGSKGCRVILVARALEAFEDGVEPSAVWVGMCNLSDSTSLQGVTLGW